MLSERSFKQYFQEFAAFLFILLFTYAGFSKLLDYQKFRVQLGQSPLLTAFSGWVAWIIPLVEILISLFLLFPKFRTIALYASFSLMVVFTAYIVAILRFSEFIPCSCGGILQNMTWSTHLKFNLCFVLLAAGAIMADSQNKIPSIKQGMPKT
jgi:uncharacterized membrane protein YphA (DoxX/SURF4 family)